MDGRTVRGNQKEQIFGIGTSCITMITVIGSWPWHRRPRSGALVVHFPEAQSSRGVGGYLISREPQMSPTAQPGCK